MPNVDPLRPRHRKFARFYAESLNQTKAALLAGYSESRARQAGSLLMKRPEVKAEVDRLLKMAEITDEELKARIQKTVRVNFEDFIDFGPDWDEVNYLREQVAEWEKFLADTLNSKKRGIGEERKYAKKELKHCQQELRQALKVPYRVNLQKAAERGVLDQLKELEITQFGIKFKTHDPKAAEDRMVKMRRLDGLSAEEIDAITEAMLKKAGQQ